LCGGGTCRAGRSFQRGKKGGKVTGPFQSKRGGVNKSKRSSPFDDSVNRKEKKRNWVRGEKKSNVVKTDSRVANGSTEKSKSRGAVRA